MAEKKRPGDILTGTGREYIPNFAFHGMNFVMKILDILFNYSGKNIKKLNLKPGQTVVDYGCGPARYIRNASKIVGDSGKVIATDIHPLAIEMADARINRYGLKNVETVLAKGYNTNIDSEIADVVYALDMFHMIEDPASLLAEISRLCRPDARILIEDGHQDRSETKKKIIDSGYLEVVSETKSYVECRKI